MCYAKPRPRCSDHVQHKITSRTKIYNDRRESLGPQHPKTLAAKKLLKVSIQDLDTTEGGIKELKQQLELEPNNPDLLKRLNRGQIANELRTTAGVELDQQRPQALATLYSQAINYYDYAETKSIIDTTVEHNINYNSHTLNNDAEHVSQEDYDAYLNGLEQRILENHGEISEQNQKTLDLLRNTAPPTKTTMNAYSNLDRTLLTGKKQLEQEIITVAAIQQTHPRTLAAFYEGYRKQYNQEYKHLPAEERPDPPQHWVDGDLSGYKKTRSTAYAPTDPASLYAIYRLRTDPNAIPPNFKTKQQNYIAINLITADQATSAAAQQGKTPILGISMTEYAPDGTKLNKNNTWVKPPENMPQNIKDQIIKQQGIDPDKLANKPRWADVQPVIQQHLQGKTLITSDKTSTINILKNKLGIENYNPSTIDISDIASKQFSQNDPTLKTTTDTLALTNYADNIPKNTESELIGQTYHLQQQKVLASWNKKPARKDSPPLTQLPDAGRWKKN